MDSDYTRVLKAYEGAKTHLDTANRLLERAGEGNLMPADMAALAQGHAIAAGMTLLVAAFEEEFLDE